MKKLLLITACCLLFVGCTVMQKASKLASVPDYKLAMIEETVFNKPCQLKYREYECPLPTATGYCENSSHQANATFYGANTIVKENAAMDYFYCARGLPLFKGPYMTAWLIRHDNRAPNATSTDYNNALEQCEYESHKATVNTSPSIPQRAFIPTRSYELNLYQLESINNQKMQKMDDEVSRSSEQLSLKEQCIQVKGFSVTKSSSVTDFNDLKKFCPDIDNLIEPCFIP